MVQDGVMGVCPTSPPVISVPLPIFASPIATPALVTVHFFQ